MALRPKSPYSDHIERVQKEQARILREMAEAERAAKRKKKAVTAKPVGVHKIRTTTSAITLPRPKDHRFVSAGENRGVRSARRGRGRASRPHEVHAARLKFMLLCLFVAVLFFFLWRNAPLP